MRELQNRIQRALLTANGPEISATDLGLGQERDVAVPRSTDPADADERRQVERALLEADGVVSRAARSLGLSRQALYRKMERLGIVLERRPRF